MNPHCQHCIDEKREANHSEIIEVLKLEISRLHGENAQLLSRLLDKPAEPETVHGPPVTTRQAVVPWRVRQQILESEDRKRADLIRNAPKPASTEKLEQELGVDLGDEVKENV